MEKEEVTCKCGNKEFSITLKKELETNTFELSCTKCKHKYVIIQVKP